MARRLNGGSVVLAIEADRYEQQQVSQAIGKPDESRDRQKGPQFPRYRAHCELSNKLDSIMCVSLRVCVCVQSVPRG